MCEILFPHSDKMTVIQSIILTIWMHFETIRGMLYSTLLIFILPYILHQSIFIPFKMLVMPPTKYRSKTSNIKNQFNAEQPMDIQSQIHKF